MFQTGGYFGLFLFQTGGYLSPDSNNSVISRKSLIMPDADLYPLVLQLGG
jgi:hypothetical protein